MRCTYVSRQTQTRFSASSSIGRSLKAPDQAPTNRGWAICPSGLARIGGTFAAPQDPSLALDVSGEAPFLRLGACGQDRYRGIPLRTNHPGVCGTHRALQRQLRDLRDQIAQETVLFSLRRPVHNVIPILKSCQEPEDLYGRML